MSRPMDSLGVAFVLLGSLVFSSAASDQPPRDASRVLILVDNTVYPEMEVGLTKYVNHVREVFPVDFKILSDAFYQMQPPAIRAMLKQECQTGKVPVVGAIMVGPIPHAVLQRPDETLKSLPLWPVPLYYEDFDAEWHDDNSDGRFERVETDRNSNQTEIWSAWWVPPANDRPTQIRMLQDFLEKLDRYYRGELAGRDGMIFLTSNSNSVEIGEGWTVLVGETLESTGQRVTKVYSRYFGEADLTERPYLVPLREPVTEFKPQDLENVLYEGRWQHVHLLTHGNSSTLGGTQFNFSRFDQTGANIITSSGCSTGNFRGRIRGPADYSRSIANRLVFSPNTITIAFFGAASPQSSPVFPMYYTELHESLDPASHSYLAEGYYKMRNTDYSWGTRHYIFRGVDEKILIGDPFARYRRP